ncbi:cell wall hydrolase [Sphingobium nicotianae]|uniref:Cell wall hydrolase n=1 Tax=Sphingobium nicotianae TaxID=2782607 RepID=A0A9X1DBT1_9SPHN|nr:cell wall hydrolase [Sphingobium nicotianae]MBT2187121.1 cell wall hydrolase [Sphingobium nicotianae]
MTSPSMTLDRSLQNRRWFAVALMLGLIAAMAIAYVGLGGRPQGRGLTAPIGDTATAAGKPDSPVPVVEPLVLDASNPDEARKLNAGIPFSNGPNPAARPFKLIGDEATLARATDCLAAAMIYEAGDDATGERAVGQVVLNRLRHPAFPKTVCGVVFQGQERTTGCQFTFTCDGAMARTPSTAAWERARGLASQMLAGDVYKPVGYSTHYHTDWVMPYWSSSLDKVTAVDTHLFFRWKGWWGTPGAFAKQLAIPAEPAIAKLVLLSPAHKDQTTDDLLFASGQLKGSLVDDRGPTLALGPDLIGKRVGPGQLMAIEPGGNGFVMMLDKGGDPARYAEAARRICTGRAQCRLLAWTNPRATPKAFPVEEAALPSMSFSYIRIKDTGFERMLYNCEEFPSAPRIQCMAKRIPTMAPSRLIADDKGDKGRIKLPEAGSRLLADEKKSELAPTRRPVEVIKLQRPTAQADGALTPGAP